MVLLLLASSRLANAQANPNMSKPGLSIHSRGQLSVIRYRTAGTSRRIIVLLINDVSHMGFSPPSSLNLRSATLRESNLDSGTACDEITFSASFTTPDGRAGSISHIALATTPKLALSIVHDYIARIVPDSTKDVPSEIDEIDTDCPSLNTGCVRLMMNPVS